MRKKKPIRRHPIKSDWKFSSSLVTRLINKVMKDGEKRKARKLVYQAAQLVEEKTSLPFLTVFEGAVANAKPYWELRSWKMGGTKRQLPLIIKREERADYFSLLFIVEGAREAKKKTPHLPFSQLLGESIFDAYNKKGGAIQKKEAIQKKGEENKAFATFLNRR